MQISDSLLAYSLGINLVAANSIRLKNLVKGTEANILVIETNILVIRNAILIRESTLTQVCLCMSHCDSEAMKRARNPQIPQIQSSKRVSVLHPRYKNNLELSNLKNTNGLNFFFRVGTLIFESLSYVYKFESRVRTCHLTYTTTTSINSSRQNKST